MRTALYLFFFLSPLLTSSAQDFMGGAHFNAGFPFGDFKETAPELFVPEIDFFANYQIPIAPIEVGLSVGYGIYGTQLEKRNDLLCGI
jgi:hypothetical protein